MKKIFCLCLILSLFPASTLAEKYLLPHAGLRVDLAEDWTALMPENLAEQGEFLATLGVDGETLRAAYLAEQVAMEVYLPQGGQVAVAVVQDEQAAALRSITRMTEEEKAALLERFAGMSLYREVAWRTPELLTMHWSLESGGIGVTWLRAVTVRHGALYMYTVCAPGTADLDVLWAMLEGVLEGVEYLGAIRSVLPESTATATEKAEPTPGPTPGVATVRAENTAFPLEIQGLPAFAVQTLQQVKGVTEGSAQVRVYGGGKQLASAQASSRGTFELDFALPVGDGPQELTFEISRAGQVAVYHYAVELQQQAVPMEIISPVGTVLDASFELQVASLPGAYIRLITANGNLRARTGSDGLATFTLNARREGSYAYELQASLEGYQENVLELTVERRFNQRELIAEFRSEVQELPYRRLAEDPAYYANRKLEYRGRIASVGEVDGYPCLLVYTSNPGTGVWRDPVYVVCADLLSFAEGQVITVLGITRGDSYTLDGEEIPVLEGAFYLD